MPTETNPIAVSIEEESEWSSTNSAELYFVDDWGDGYFGVNEEGHVSVRPVRGSDIAVDLYEVVEDLRERGIRYPALIRFQDLLKSRIDHLNQAFQEAITEFGYDNVYQGVYPVKVNQLREVLEEIIESGAPYGHGLECGSKSELVATLPYLADRDTLLLCNGSKDRDMMRLMLAGQRLGKRVYPILERDDEFELLCREAHTAGVHAGFGIRVRLTTRGAGLWSESGGEHSKFGLSLTELVELVRAIDSEQLPVSLKLLHFHLGSQIADLRTLEEAVEEATRVYGWLREKGVEVEYFDVGGGLGVSYEAGNPRALGAINYRLDDYARAVVATVGGLCDEMDVPHPVLVSESGRAVTAHHSVLIVEAVGSRRKAAQPLEEPGEKADPLVRAMREIYRRAHEGDELDSLSGLERIYTEAVRLRKEMTVAFRAGKLDVEQKASFERIFWATCIAIDLLAKEYESDDLPAPLAGLGSQLVDHYQCNFSIFRSMVDYWAIGQRFPIMPIHRLNSMPTRRGILVDLTCDSDGKVDTFVSSRGDKRHLELHELRSSERYFLGMFLMGAYQDIMGDMHNLFGRVTEVHVFVDENEPGSYYIEEILPGASIEEQLELVQYHANDLERRMGDLIQKEVKAGNLRPKDGVKLLNQYRNLFREMTYLDTEPE